MSSRDVLPSASLSDSFVRWEDLAAGEGQLLPLVREYVAHGGTAADTRALLLSMMINPQANAQKMDSARTLGTVARH